MIYYITQWTDASIGNCAVLYVLALFEKRLQKREAFFKKALLYEYYMGQTKEEIREGLRMPEVSARLLAHVYEELSSLRSGSSLLLNFNVNIFCSLKYYIVEPPVWRRWTKGRDTYFYNTAVSGWLA